MLVTTSPVQAGGAGYTGLEPALAAACKLKLFIPTCNLTSLPAPG